jgi:acetyltransferase-like isoleucine patch superfamily enzyme
MNSINFFHYFIGLPKTVFFNFRFFNFKTACRLPVLLTKDVRVRSKGGKITIPKNSKFGTIKIGSLILGNRPRSSKTTLEIHGILKFEGKASIGSGSSIFVGNNGLLEFGSDFYSTGFSNFISFKNISFGNRCLISWDCLFMDSDFHKIKIGKIQVNYDENINVGNNVWICCNSTLLKGSIIPSNCVVAENANVTSKFDEENSIIGGNPARILKSGISWEV